MLSALLLRQLQPTRYREVVLTSLHHRNSPGNRPFFLSNTLMEHYPLSSLLDSLPSNQDNTQFRNEGLLGTGEAAPDFPVTQLQ